MYHSSSTVLVRFLWHHDHCELSVVPPWFCVHLPLVRIYYLQYHTKGNLATSYDTYHITITISTATASLQLLLQKIHNEDLQIKKEKQIYLPLGGALFYTLSYRRILSYLSRGIVSSSILYLIYIIYEHFPSLRIHYITFYRSLDNVRIRSFTGPT